MILSVSSRPRLAEARPTSTTQPLSASVLCGSSSQTLSMLAAGLVAGLLSLSASAHPTGPRGFCEQYASAPVCSGQVPNCALCHTTPPTLNSFGSDVGGALWAMPAYAFNQASYDTHLGSALLEVEAHDADGDGMSNLEELTLGTLPGDARSLYEATPLPEGRNDFYKLGQWDAKLAFKRVSVLYCGKPARYEELRAFATLTDDEARTSVLDRLSACLTTDYWKSEGLHRIADKRIRPLESVGFDGIIPLADYAWDYRLFSYIMTDGRDARDLLLADYHIDEDGNVVEGALGPPPGSLLGSGGQPVPPEKRAGMITTQWFLMIHTMFSTLPRTTAAQAYRAYLGQDIAKSEGILPVEGEPRDVDEKGVTAPACAHCHSTIDPLSYAFSLYNGIGEPGDLYEFGESGSYNPTRTPWGGDSVLLGEPVTDLVSWAETAVESDMFKRNLVLIFWKHALGREPLPGEEEVVISLYKTLPVDGYSANKVIERIVLTDAFGVP